MNPCLVDRFVHCGTGRNSIHEEHLINRHPKDAQHLALQLFQRKLGETPEMPIQQHLVLEHTIAKPSGQSRLPPVQPILPEHTLQISV